VFNSLNGEITMRNLTLIAQMLVRITGLIQVVLGVLFWLGLATSLVVVHIFSGLVFVASLWLLAFAALRTRTQPGLATLTVLYGALMVGLGIYQGALLPGPAHWVVQAVHLLVGLGGMGIAQRLSSAILARVSGGGEQAGKVLSPQR
jgi:hypothetical protein